MSDAAGALLWQLYGVPYGVTCHTSYGLICDQWGRAIIGIYDIRTTSKVYQVFATKQTLLYTKQVNDKHQVTKQIRNIEHPQKGKHE